MFMNLDMAASLRSKCFVYNRQTFYCCNVYIVHLQQ